MLSSTTGSYKFEHSTSLNGFEWSDYKTTQLDETVLKIEIFFIIALFK